MTAETTDTGDATASPGEQPLAVDVVPSNTALRAQCRAAGLQEGMTNVEPFLREPPLGERTEDRGEKAAESNVRGVRDNRASLAGKVRAGAEVGTVGLTACGDVHWLAHRLREALSNPTRGAPVPTVSLEWG